MRIYVAGALSTLPEEIKDKRSPSQVVVDYIQNVSHLCKIGTELRMMGHYPYVPGLDFILGVVNGGWREHDYRDTSMAFLEVCNAVYIASVSKGVKKEVERAEALGIPVYLRMKDIPNPN